MNPEIIDIIKLIKSYDFVNEKIGIASNAIKLTPKITDELVKIGNIRIKVNVDSTTKEIYKELTNRNSLERVEKNLNYFYEKNKKSGNSCKLLIRPTLNDKNRDQKDEFIRKWKDKFDIKFTEEMSWSGNVEGGKEVADISKSIINVPCLQLWGGIYIDNEGKVSMCCMDVMDHTQDFGDFNKENFDQIITNQNRKKIQNIHKEHKWDMLPSLCKNCDLMHI